MREIVMQIAATSADTGIRSFSPALEFYSPRPDEVFE